MAAKDYTLGVLASANIPLGNGTNITLGALSTGPSYAFPTAHFEFDPFIYGDSDDSGTTPADTTAGTPSLVGGEYYDLTPDSGFTYNRNGGINDDYGSIEIWVSPDQVVNNGNVFTASQNTTDDFRFQIGQFGTTFTFYIKGASGSFYGRIDVTSAFSATAWYHIVVTRKTGVALYSTAALAYDCYINGSLVTTNISKTGSGYWLGYIDGYTPWNITVGGYVLNNIGLHGAWDGKVGRAAIYVDPLTSTQVSDNYTELTTR